jgi:ABC-type Fe3+-hydroxamate transport system substrate-binding protein
MRVFYLVPVLLVAALLFTISSCEDRTSVTVNEIETQIREILELPTYEHVYRDIIYVGEEATFLLFKTVDKQVLFSIDVVVQAGIDFTEGLHLIPGKDKEITVRLPPAKILLIDAEEDSIHQYFIKERGEAVTRLEYYDEINRQKEKIREDAIQRGILYNAEQNAQQLITQFLRLAGFTDISFETIIPPRRQHQPGENSPSNGEGEESAAS